MNIVKYLTIIGLSSVSCALTAQTEPSDSSKTVLNEVIISANKVNEPIKNIAQQVKIISAKDIENAQAQNTADLLGQTGNVFIQKSQQGGGSAVIRGFEASRVLYVVDGVRMNNIIYRSGHLQNIITVDNAVLDRVEVLFGPASTMYGTDALGGAVCMFTKRPILGVEDGKVLYKNNSLVRYGSVNNELTAHTDFNFGTKSFASLTSVTFSKFGDLKGGKNQNPFYNGSYGERPYYVQRFGDRDSLVKNDNRYLQRQTAYSQYDILEKLLYSPSDDVSHGLNIQFSNSTNIPRYDRLTDPTSTGLSYAEWYYGPQRRLLAAYNFDKKNEDGFLQNIHFGVNYQNIEESRSSRKFNNANLSTRTENVQVMGANLDLRHKTEQHDVRFGADFQFNTLKSTAVKRNIITDATSALDTRYPDGGNTQMNMGAYFSHTWKINPTLMLNDGARIGGSMLRSTFNDTTFFPLPYKEAKQNSLTYSASIGLVHNPAPDWKLSVLLSTGFRTPNVDDLSKIFDSGAGVLIVPNEKLGPEKTLNTELNITKLFGNKTSWENTIYYTYFYDAIVTDKFSFNGKDSAMYEGVTLPTYANQNKGKAFIYGFSSNLNAKAGEHFRFSASLNYTYGRIKTDSTDAPLDHISPFMAKVLLGYQNGKFNSEFFVHYNSWKRLKDYYLNGEDNEQYATPEGMPAWFTANIRASYQLHKYINLQVGIDNMFDTQYRTFASGMNAPGRNIFVALRAKI